MSKVGIAKNEVLDSDLEQLKFEYLEKKKSLAGHLERLEVERSLNYSDYLNIDILLNLQQPKTNFTDEPIFIVYHQIVELYFYLILWEIRQITQPETILTMDAFEEKINRINRYYDQVITSFPIMADGLDKKQFMKFRYALFPASGFQSRQYREIEILSTDAINLVSKKFRATYSEEKSLYRLYEKIYWKRGAIETASGEKSVTLTDFEQSNDADFCGLLEEFTHKNLYQIYQKHYAALPNNYGLKKALRRFDHLANVDWPEAHLKVAIRHLSQQGKQKAKSTGGTNWSKYLNPRLQDISFFPSLWTEEELNRRGKKEGQRPRKE